MASAAIRPPLIEGHKTPQQVTSDICAVLDRKPGPLWLGGFLFSLSLLLLGAAAVTYQVAVGIGTWGLNKTVGWAFDITNFVFWVGIGHAGTLISAVLFLLRQQWRTSVNRAAEAMTIFAVICAGLFPVIHMGRPWLAHCGCSPIPTRAGRCGSTSARRSFGISSRSLTYFTISATFWYVGMMPDLATIRDRAQPGFRKKSLRCARTRLGRLLQEPGCATKRSTSCWPGWRRRW